jgi:hypothetical protein
MSLSDVIVAYVIVLFLDHLQRAGECTRLHNGSSREQEERAKQVEGGGHVAKNDHSFISQCQKQDTQRQSERKKRQIFLL